MNNISEKHKVSLQSLIYSDDLENVIQGLELLETLAEDEKDWYPPFIVFVEEFNGKQMLGTIQSKWCMEYDPNRAGKENPLDILRRNGVEV